MKSADYASSQHNIILPSPILLIRQSLWAILFKKVTSREQNPVRPFFMEIKS